MVRVELPGPNAVTLALVPPERDGHAALRRAVDAINAVVRPRGVRISVAEQKHGPRLYRMDVTFHPLRGGGDLAPLVFEAVCTARQSLAEDGEDVEVPPGICPLPDVLPPPAARLATVCGDKSGLSVAVWDVTTHGLRTAYTAAVMLADAARVEIESVGPVWDGEAWRAGAVGGTPALGDRLGALFVEHGYEVQYACSAQAIPLHPEADRNGNDPRDNPRREQGDLVQLASTWEGWPAGTKRLLAEPKIDGWRLVAKVSNDSVTFMSRSGIMQPYTRNLRHIGEQLLAMGARTRGMWFDGEVQVKTWNGTGLVGVETLSAEDRKTLETHAVFWVFDVVEPHRGAMSSDTPLEGRRKLLEHAIGRGTKNIHVVEQTAVHGEREVNAQLRRYLAAGAEGVMLKDPHAPYRPGRSDRWLKLKPVQTVDGVIVGMRPGKGRHAGRLGALDVKLSDGTIIGVGTGISDAQRSEWWRRRKAMLGMWVEIEHEVSSVSAARNGRLVRLRTDRAPKRGKALRA